MSSSKAPGLATPTPVEYCPVVLGVEVITERWNLLISRELMMGATRFTEIHASLPGLSRTVLSQRLRSLQQYGLVERLGTRYRLTAAGHDLKPILFAIGEWAVLWRFPAPSPPSVITPVQFARQMRAGLNTEMLPPEKVVVEITFEEKLDSRRAWMILDGENSSVCTRDPLYGIDVYASATSVLWNEIWFGFRSFESALREESLHLTGTIDYVRRFPGWFKLSRFAPMVAMRDAA